MEAEGLEHPHRTRHAMTAMDELCALEEALTELPHRLNCQSRRARPCDCRVAILWGLVKRIRAELWPKAMRETHCVKCGAIFLTSGDDETCASCFFDSLPNRKGGAD